MSAQGSLQRAQFGAYVLVHPESFPGNEHDVDEDRYGAAIRQAGHGKRRVAILDSANQDNLAETGDLTVGVRGRKFRQVAAEPHELGSDRVAAQLKQHLGNIKGRVDVGGYHRSDCVPTVVHQLRSLGYDAHLHDVTTLPGGKK